MAHEIERKFLVAGEGWREAAVRCERLVDGLLATSKGRKVRVRLYEDRATLTIKTGKKGRLRLEFEYDIPRVDAEHLMARECGASVVAKTRHFVPHEGFTWEVDVYEGVLQGVVLAEVELASVDQDPPRPAWVGREVTEDPAFRKQRLFVEALRRSFGEPTRAAKPGRRRRGPGRASEPQRSGRGRARATASEVGLNVSAGSPASRRLFSLPAPRSCKKKRPARRRRSGGGAGGQSHSPGAGPFNPRTWGGLRSRPPHAGRRRP